ncbi:MAG: SpoIIE family protein phosphatase [Bacteroidales bacterium]|nr:SpoIIE family protein phosphatase [Bacteroidales bacterium]
MKQQENSEKKAKLQSRLGGLMLIIVAVVTLEATSIIQYYFSQKGIKEEANQRAQSELEATELKIMDVVNQAEAAVRNSMWIAQWCLNVPDSLMRVTQRIVADNPVVKGSTVALVPGYSKKYPLYSPYTAAKPDGSMESLSLATEEYNYPAQEWFTKPIELDGGYWSEPYFDEGGGNILMVTYSLPVKDAAGRIAAVLTADISLDWLTEMVGSVHVYPTAFSMVISRAGQFMVCPAETLVMKSSVHEFAGQMEDSAAIAQLNNAMLSGQSGSMEIRSQGLVHHVFFAPVSRTGWSLSIVIPDEEIFGKLKSVGRRVMLLQFLGILMIILILRSVARNQIKYKALNERKEKMQSELQIAHNIQMSMIPKIFPAFPERKDLDMSAMLVPAKEVGGDLYDFFIRDEHLFFCVGDVSGKGVPASLVMAVTRSLFRSLSNREKSPATIVTQMNDSMSDMNESNMFVTLFIGVLDMKTGHLDYCNAGHNAPVLFTDHISMLEVEPNLPLGIIQDFQYKEQSVQLKNDDALFLYTDGVTEAENIHHELFGEERMEAVLHTRRSAQEHLEAMRNAIAAFVGEAPQSDDITLLFIHYLG